ncbi:hypothetical protein TWF481_003622 [Arthrobotrys musiformis]|uniref:Uncharacterized protein n=1 Tax=Arthrobotrys musiformis TaxID=47236 RepID=A0AAV9WH54_9PEZI
MTNFDTPYFTTSNAYQDSNSGVNREGVVAYRTTAGDLALFDLSNTSSSSVLLLTETWEFTTQPLDEYNRSGGGVGVIGGIKERISTGWWTAESLKNKAGIGLRKFEVNVHSDFGGEVLFVELAWMAGEKDTSPYDVVALLAAAHTPLPQESAATWHPIIARTKSLGLVLSLKSENFGQPIAALSMPLNRFPYAEYVLNSYYIAGIVPITRQFAFLRYARDDIDTVCSMEGERREGYGSQLFWGLPGYLPSVAVVDLKEMGLTEFCTKPSLIFANNLDIHVQVDRVGELVFVTTGAGVTAFDVRRMSQYGEVTVVKSLWWRQKDAMTIFIPSDEDLDKEEVRRVGSWREGMWARDAAKSGTGKKLIAPSVPRIWKSFLPGQTFGGGGGDEEMFTLVRGYNHVVRLGGGEIPFEQTRLEVPAWQGPEFLVAWEIPLRREGLEKYSPRMLNRRAGYQDPDDDHEPACYYKGEPGFSCYENPEGIYPNKIMQLQTAMTTNLAGVLRCFEPHLVLSIQMPAMFFAKRDTHRAKPRWLAIKDHEIAVEGDEYREIVGPVEKGRWKPERQPGGILKLQKRQERVLLRVDRDIAVPCERPYPRTVRFGKRRSGLMSMFWGKGEALQVPTEKAPAAMNEHASEILPNGNIHHVKVGDSGNYIAYAINVSPTPTYDHNKYVGPSGTLVIVRYN